MSRDRRVLALQAARYACEVRRLARIPFDSAVCVYDLAEQAGIEVRFADLPSMEGVYYPAKPAIIVSSLRPQGRQAFTCAHELGHHVYRHGEQFDELIEERGQGRTYDQKEYVADCFAGALLMPKLAVMKGLSNRSLRAKHLAPEDVYRLASWLGVGYTALVNHLGRVLRLVSPEQAAALAKLRLPAIRKSLLGFDCSQHLIIADEAWSGRPIDADVSDLIMLPADATLEGAVLETLHRDQKLCIARAAKPGIGRVLRPNTTWAHFTRVSRKQFIGMFRFRHLEEVDDE